MAGSSSMMPGQYFRNAVMVNGVASSSTAPTPNNNILMNRRTLVGRNGATNNSSVGLIHNGYIKLENNKTSNMQQVAGLYNPNIVGVGISQAIGAPMHNTSQAGFYKEEIKSEIEVKEEVIDVPDDDDEEEEEPVIDIVINNVVCSFSVCCHLDLRSIALAGNNVEFRRENGMVTMKLRRPLTTASIWSSGKITCTGSTSEVQSRIAARRVARSLQKLGYNTRFKNFRVVNVLGTCMMPFAIKITQFSQKFRAEASYEPELHPGVTFKIPHPKATLKIFSTGSITVTAPSVSNVQNAIEHIYPLVKEFSKIRSPEEIAEYKRNHAKKFPVIGVETEDNNDPNDDLDDDF